MWPPLTGGLLESETELCELSANFIFAAQFSEPWASCQFYYAGFPSLSASTAWAFTELGFCCGWPRLVGAEPRLLQPGYIRVTETDMWGECVISSILSCCSKDLKLQTSVKAWLKLSFIWQAKDSTPSRHNQSRFLLFIHFVSFSLSLPYANWLAKKRVCFTWSSHSGPQISFVLFSRAFLFLCLLGTAILDSFFLF